MYICNAFSLKMLPEWVAIGTVQFHRLTLEEATLIAREENIESAVGHADTAALFSALLGVPVPVNRVEVKLLPVDAPDVLVGQYSGPRLPEGATSLPEGASIDWMLVSFDEKDIIEFAPEEKEEEEEEEEEWTHSGVLARRDPRDACPTCVLTQGYCGGENHPSCGLFEDGRPVPAVR